MKGGKHTCVDWRRKRAPQKNASCEATRAGAYLVVAIRAFNGALALQMPVHLHSRVEHVCARPNAATAEVKHSSESG